MNRHSRYPGITHREKLGSFLCAAIFILCAGVAGAGTDTAGGLAAPAFEPRKVVLPQGAKLSERLVGLPGLSNVGRIAPGVFRGNQPKPEGYATLRAMGIRTVINFRARHGEKTAVEAAGMRSIEFPMSMLEKPKASDVARIVALMADPANQPVYIHCALGKDRTGVVVAAYRMDVDGWTLKEALEEMEGFGFNGQWVHLKRFITDYGKKRSKQE